ncbi:uncharacterized protein LOC111687413 [Lucilia cuprina]|uniref:uncharacterized protein LOC111687413 n=1 Tax=Lucilia cuprina TaxID=7375 RepID=UPI001F06EA74|nr:uncharacterized protein LOC111687413 [Lucilia cuprina]
MSSPDSKEINLVRCLKCGKILKCSRYDTAALLEHIRTDHPEVDVVDTDTKRKRSYLEETTKRNQNSPVNRYKGQTEPDNEIKQCCECSDEDCNVDKCQPYNADQNVSYVNTEDEEREKQWPRPFVTHYAVTSEILEKYPEIKECEYCPRNPNAEVVYTRRYRLNTPSTVNEQVLQQPFQRNLYCTSIEKWCPADGTIYCPKCGCNKRPLIKTKAQRFSNNECAACCLLSCWPFCFLPWLLQGPSQDYLHCANCKTFLGLYDRNTNCVQPNRLYITVDPNDQCFVKDDNSVANEKAEKLLDNESPPPSSAGDDSANVKRLPSIVVDGKELSPDVVARLQKFKKYGSLAGIDLDALTNPSDSPNSTKRNGSYRQNQKAPSNDKANRKTVVKSA